MLFLTLINKKFTLSYYQFQKFICQTRLPTCLILLKTSSLREKFSTLLFKAYFHELFINKQLVTHEAISFFTRLRTERGIRHLFNLPVNGQRSKTNANTQRRKGKVLSKNQLKKLAKAQSMSIRKY